ncbi:MAG: hypothetical protein BGO74_16340 [Burkholderiales bacterium 68-12]|nr:MAG: hypothetical protein BGO74_16340 [Burkholderiales bacterium 68-12]
MPESRSLPASLHSLQTFGAISRFLREGVADEDSREMREGVGALAQVIDETVKVRRARQEAGAVTAHARILVRVVREHLRFLTGLGSAWHALYEFGAYQSALQELRRAAEAWLKALEQRSSREGGAFERLELLAWRTLGEGMLLIDMYEQGSGGMLSAVPESAPPPARSPWARLAAWYRRLRG